MSRHEWWKKLHISLGHKKQSEEDIKRFEDALTSAFFGTLRYLPPRIVEDLFISVLGTRNALAKNELIKLYSDDVRVEMNFWPNIADEGRVEPDLKICLFYPGNSQIDLLIECKWKSGESSDCQLHGQWVALTQADRLKTYHIYLVRDLQKGCSDRDNNIRYASGASNWDDRLFVISWYELLKSLTVLSINGLDKHSSGAVMQWKEDMTAMFGRIGIHGFCGFKVLSNNIEATVGKVFWSSPFLGFQQFINCSVSTAEGVVFFK